MEADDELGLQFMRFVFKVSYSTKTPAAMTDRQNNSKLAGTFERYGYVLCSDSGVVLSSHSCRRLSVIKEPLKTKLLNCKPNSSAYSNHNFFIIGPINYFG